MIKKIFNYFSYINFNRKVLRPSSEDNNGSIIIEFFDMRSFGISGSYFAHTLSKLHKFGLSDINNCLSSSGIPDPDILIRSGGYKRISDFMLYQISFTELFFTSKLWPSINKYDVKRFIEKFNKIDRKFGN